MKQFDKKDVFTLVTAEEAKAYIGKQGYFGDSLEELEEDIKNKYKMQLENVYPDRYTSIVFRPYASDTSYGLFIPVDKIKEIEKPKKWRPFKNSKEFINTVKKCLGDSITFRYKEENESNSSALITSFSKELYVTFGGRSYSYEQLFYYLEWFNGNTWKPFGILDEN